MLFSVFRSLTGWTDKGVEKREISARVLKMFSLECFLN